MANRNFELFWSWEKAIRSEFPEAPKFTKKAARVEWMKISRKQDYADILKALEENLLIGREFNRQKAEFNRNVELAGLTRQDESRMWEGLMKAGYQGVRDYGQHLMQFTMLLKEIVKSGKVTSREWSQRYADDETQVAQNTCKWLEQEIEDCRAFRKQLGSVGPPVEPLLNPFGDEDEEMEEPNNEDLDGDMDEHMDEDDVDDHIEEGLALEDGWKCQKELGKGSYGKVSLWVRFDKNGRVAERVAVKEVAGGPKHDHMVRNEAYIHEKISAQDPDGRHAVIFRGKHLFYKKGKHRLYLEFCPYGDVFNVVNRLFERRHAFRQEYQQMGTSMLWALFESLAGAVHLMAFGHFPGKSPVKRWDGVGVIHQDMKPENTFLSDPLKNRWPGIPSMKVGDFGLAVLESDPTLQTRGGGTPGFMAPEIEYVRRHTLPEDIKISTMADIWTIGIIMSEIMNLGTQQKGGFYTLDQDESELPTINMANRYPHSLVVLVGACLQRVPDDRIDVKNLCECIEIEVGQENLSSARLSELDKDRFPISDERLPTISKLTLA